MSEAYSELIQMSIMEHFAKIVNGQKPLTIFTRHSVLDVWQGPKTGTTGITLDNAKTDFNMKEESESIFLHIEFLPVCNHV